MAYRYESTARYEMVSSKKPTMQEITQAILELGKKAEYYALRACACSDQASEAIIKAKQVLEK